MNIVFMGTPRFAVPSLQLILDSHHVVSAVVTIPDKPRGRGQKISESDVKKLAAGKKLKLFQPVSLKDEKFLVELKAVNPDVIVVAAFRILPREVFQIPRFGSFNLHASLLPKLRGAAPVNWALINGEKETGVTTFFLNERVDTGNIILQNKCEITADDDAGTLHDKLAELGANTVLSTLNLIEAAKGDVPVYTQDESLFTTAPKITKEFCKINWDNRVEILHNFIRGLSPVPAAFTTHDGKSIKIFRTTKQTDAKEIDHLPLEPGKIIILNNHLFVSANDGYIEILELQLEGKKRLSISEFLKGYKFRGKDFFGS